MKNQLFHGDNLDIMRDRLADESVDLTHLDPPFNFQPKLQRVVQGEEWRVIAVTV